MKVAKLIVLSGPSGVGKKTVIDLAKKEFGLSISYSISATTRKMRANEKDKKDYFFLTKEQFKKAIDEDGFLEYATFMDNYYGTPKNYVDAQIKKGNDVLLEIEVQGAEQVMEHRAYNMEFVFIAPPSLEELESRLTKRNTETPAEIKKRVETAKGELAQMNLYDHIIVNKDARLAAKQLVDIIKA